MREIDSRISGYQQDSSVTAEVDSSLQFYLEKLSDMKEQFSLFINSLA
mgnify:CR=1 FL=1